MSTRKSFDRVCIAVLIASLLLTALFMDGAAFGLQSAGRSMGYESRLFDTSKVHTLAIVIDDWDGFLENCENEEYAACSVVIDGESYKNVGLRAKGNTSLTTVRSLDSTRYSLKLEFDHYESGKTYHGLDKLCLNNIIQDNTYMKDYLTYRLMYAFGADAPLCSYVWITVNGADWGLYLAVEGVEDAFLQRNYGSDYGELYKPDSQSFGGGGPGRGRDFRMSEFWNEANADSDADASDSGDTASASRQRGGMRGMGGRGNMGDGGFNPGDMGGGMPFPSMPFPGAMGGESTASGGATVSGDSFPGFPGMSAASGDSFPGFDATGGFGDMPFPGFPGGMSVGSGDGFGGGFGGMRGMGSDDVKLKYTDDDPDSYSSIFENAKTDVTAADKARLIASLKALGEAENLESVVNMDEVLRYFVVHNYVVNGDSYTGSMIHNYYLYEKDGQLSMIPWDYNLAFGGFQGGSASGSVNDPIDAPLSVSGDGDRPMADWLLQDEYIDLYHAYFNDFLNSVDVTAVIDEVSPLIASYVERDPTKFCTYDEFEKGVAALRTFCELRTQSVRGQLDGVIPSTDDAQSADSSALIDASALTISDMGSMNRGGFGGFGGRSSRTQNATSDSAAQASGETAPPNDAQASDSPTPQASVTSGDAQADVPAFPGNFSGDGQTMSGGFPGDASAVSGGGFGGNMGGGFPGGMGGDFPGFSSDGATSLSALSTETWVSLGASVAVLLAGLLAARLYPRRKRVRHAG